MLQIVFAAILFVIATLATGAAFPVAVSVAGVGSIITIGLLVGAFRVQVDELLRASARNAATDPLTGLANRRAFADAYLAERARQARSGTCGAVLVLDCDRFKELNDRHGHAAGDRALLSVAAAMSAVTRELDTSARLGGDEFAVLLSASEPGAAVAVGERIRRALALGTASPPTTVSIGLVELPPDRSVDLGTALATADRAMYQSKHRGGDCVSVAKLPEEPVGGSRLAIG
jgi:diguanylate cyclase (GGDEF)-like protein